MAIRGLFLLSPLALVACGPAAAPPADPAAPTAATDPAPANADRPTVIAPSTPAQASPAGQALAGPPVGEYRVAGVDGAEIDLPHGISARIEPGAIHVASDCVRMGWRYSATDSGIVTERISSQPTCERALMAEEEALAAAFDHARSVRRTPENGIEFAGADRSVLLFSQ